MDLKHKKVISDKKTVASDGMRCGATRWRDFSRRSLPRGPAGWSRGSKEGSRSIRGHIGVEISANTQKRATGACMCIIHRIMIIELIMN